MGRAGGIGIGTIILLVLVGWALGINPLYLIGGAEILSRMGGSPQQSQPAPRSRKAEAPTDQTKEFVSAVLGSTEVQWKEIFARAGKTYQPPSLVMFSGGTSSACGIAQSAMGPFYCPNDQKVYLDTSFFQDLERQVPRLRRRKQGLPILASLRDHARGRPSRAEFARHSAPGAGGAAEYGPVEANQLQVRVELQADCFAGVWAHHAEEKWRLIEPGDIEAAMQTASAIGDDRLQRRTQGYVVPDAFTHGSSEQRVRWFMNGLKSGQVAGCDTFQAGRL